MTQREFEERIGREVTLDEYARANAMYMAADNVDKDVFCKEYGTLKDSKTFNDIVDRYYNENKSVYRLTEEKAEMLDMLIQNAEKYGDESMAQLAIKIMGEREYLRRKIRLGVQLCDDDYAYIYENLK